MCVTLLKYLSVQIYPFSSFTLNLYPLFISFINRIKKDDLNIDIPSFAALSTPPPLLSYSLRGVPITSFQSQSSSSSSLLLNEKEIQFRKSLGRFILIENILSLNLNEKCEFYALRKYAMEG